MFTSEVQFGHAGSLAGSALEKAAAKNRALAACGAVVPDSFDTLGAAVREVTRARTRIRVHTGVCMHGSKDESLKCTCAHNFHKKSPN